MNAQDKAFHIAYKIDIFAKEPLRHDDVYVDAKTGNILAVVPILISANGTAETRYSGTRAITTEIDITTSLNDTTYRLRDVNRGIETLDANHYWKIDDCILYADDIIDDDNFWSALEYHNVAKDDGALDAHWGAMMTYDYFQSVHGRDSYDDNGGILRNYVHFGINYDNAEWNKRFECILFGDGGVRSDMVTSLDIVAHEIGHGVCQFSAELVYLGESGAISESLSDIWGACVENWATTDKQTWLIGEDIALQSTAIRSMSNPKMFENPDTYEGTYWIDPSSELDYGGVHTNSSVMNHWFYILSVGKSGVNDFGYQYDVAGIGITKAEIIVYRAETRYIEEDTDFFDAKTCTILAAIDLYGACSPEMLSVIDAWHAVGLEANRINNDTDWISNIITADVIVETGATLTITGTVSCTDKAQIIIQPGGKLVIDGGKLTAACPDSLWQGIVVLGDASKQQLPQHQGSVELINGAVIEHALCAISAASESYGAASGGGIIYAEDAIFRNNLKAIEYRSYGNSSGSVGEIVIPDNVGKFINCTFSFDENNRFSANGKTFRNHVTLYEVRGVTFEACTFEENIISTAKLPAPENYGIYTIDAGFKVINRCKKGGVTQQGCPCLSSHTEPCLFQNLVTGIRSESTGNPYDIYIDQSEFQNLSVGVRMDAQDNYRLTRNKFVNSTTGLSSYNSSGYKIEENNFSAPLVTATGILMNNSGGVDNRIYKNWFNYLNEGFRIQSINGPSSPFQMSPSLHGLQFLQNIFVDNKYDVKIAQGATVRTHQGAQSTGANNKFIGTLTSSIFSQSIQEIYYYHTPCTNCDPYNPTNNVEVIDNAAGGQNNDPCLTPSKSEPLTDSIAQYKKMQAQYDKLFAELENNPKILQELLVLGDEMYELSRHAIHRILQDSILYLDALTAWYEVIRTPVAKYLLAEAHAFTKDYEKAESVLKNMPELFKFGETEEKEHDNYLKFFNFKKEMTLSGRNWADLKEDEVKELETIAQATCGRSATMAQGVLCFFFDSCKEYEDCRPKEEMNPKIAEAGIEFSSENLKEEISIHPNPTTGELVVDSGELIVEKTELFDIFGRMVFETKENISNINHLQGGLYIVKVYLENGQVVTRKVVKR